MFFGCSCVSGRSELTALLPAGLGPITSRCHRRAPLAGDEGHRAVTAPTCRDSCDIHRAALDPGWGCPSGKPSDPFFPRGTARPGRASSRTCPGVAGPAGAAAGPVHTHHAFLLLTWTWQRRFKACPERAGTRGKGGPKGGPAAPSPGSAGDAVGSPAAPSAGARTPQRIAPGQSPGLGALGAAPALTLSPEPRQQRQEQEQPQRPGPAEVVHRRGALAPSGSRLSCGVRWVPPSRLLLLAVIPAA